MNNGVITMAQTLTEYHAHDDGHVYTIYQPSPGVYAVHDELANESWDTTYNDLTTAESAVKAIMNECYGDRWGYC